jgi:LysM domain
VGLIWKRIRKSARPFGPNRRYESRLRELASFIFRVLVLIGFYMKNNTLTGIKSKKTAIYLIAIPCSVVFTSAWAAIDQPTEPYISYTVKTGDKLERVARDLLTDPRKWNELARLNGLKDPNFITPGQVLDVPRSRQRRSCASRCSRA